MNCSNIIYDKIAKNNIEVAFEISVNNYIKAVWQKMIVDHMKSTKIFAWEDHKRSV